MRAVLAQEAGALHSRTIEKRIAAEKRANMNWILLNGSIVASLKFVAKHSDNL